MMMDRIKHEAIAASAGSGKTFQLAHRYIRLLTSGVKPDRIAALTFSRKAAGEIFDSIIRYLREASSLPQQAKQTGKMLGKTEFEQSDFIQLLRVLIDNLHRLHIGTLDSFTVGVTRAFPIELGIPSEFRLLESDGAEAKRNRQEVLSRIFSARHTDSAIQNDFLEAFKQATFGKEEKELGRNLDIFINRYRGYYQLLPGQDTWGQETLIWPSGPLWEEPPGDIAAAGSELKVMLADSGFPGQLLKSLEGIIDFASNYSESMPWNEKVAGSVAFKALMAGGEGLKNGMVTIPYNRGEYVLSGQQCKLMFKLLSHVVSTELRSAIKKTEGIYNILDRYEQFYDDMMRRRGKLTFTDIQYLLTAANNYSGGALVSRTRGLESRLYIDYRLDSSLDHWLLDEFQDTSDLQWEVLRNLADEILQDISGERSFFYVGDVKQAIYGWRGGNARLFGKVLKQYDGLIEQIPLNISFRSCQPVIDTINRVFGKLPEDELPAGAIKEWETIWQEHRCQKDVVPENGYVSLLEPQCNGGETRPADADRYRIAASLLQEIEPLKRGLSVAILVRTNDSGREIVDFLRRECPGMDVVHEGIATIEDNPVVAALLALVKFAAHPGDTFAWRHLQMSPLREYFSREQLDRNNLPLALLKEIQSSGFQTFLCNWGAKLHDVHMLDDFGRKRLNNLINAAIEFDGGGSRDCNAFLRFIDGYQVHELAADNAVRVMTIHQSKGLGFDIVILPDLQNGNMARSKQVDFTIYHDFVSNQALWALRMPRRIIAESDPVLSRQVQADDEINCFDSLCLLYVALTRARQGLYMITSFPGRSAAVMTPAALLKLQLTGDAKQIDGSEMVVGGEEFLCLYEAGESNWYMKVPEIALPVETAESRELPEEFGRRYSLRRRLLNVSPSMLDGGELRADSLFSCTAQDSLDFGNAIHELFEKVSWIDEVDVEDLIRGWEETSTAAEDIKQRAAEQFRQALNSAEVRQALSLPEGNIDLWREKHFEIIIDDQWITGAFDRVTVVRDSEGRPIKATVLDFKSGDISCDAELADSAEKYRSQLSLYRSALSRMLQISPSQVALRLLFTHPGRVYDLE